MVSSWDATVVSYTRECTILPSLSMRMPHYALWGKRTDLSTRREHVTGHKRERKSSTDWYCEIKKASIRRIEAEWQVRQHDK